MSSRVNINSIFNRYEAAEELYVKRKSVNLTPGRTSTTSEEPLMKKSKIEPGTSHDTSSEDSSPGTWSFSSSSGMLYLPNYFTRWYSFVKVACTFQLCTDEEDDPQVDIVMFMKNMQKKYNKIVSQTNTDAQIFMSISLVRIARSRLPIE